MPASLDMSLDEIIRRKERPEPRGAPGPLRRRPNRGPGPLRRRPNRGPGPLRSAPYFPPPMHRLSSSSAPRAPVMAPIWRQEEGPFGGTSEPEAGTKLYISNLDYDVTNEDIMLLFSDVGDIERYGIHYDRSGRSKGTAEVVFSRHSDALAAIKRYNNVRLDGKPMKIEIVGLSLFPPAPLLPLPLLNSSVGRFRTAFASGQGSGAEKPYQGGSSQGPPRVGGPGKAILQKPSAKDLDAELDRYHFEARQSS
ncbi:THO complex subunit 4A-like [Syzygium oleosum]|uniref:THO complex subunit 4A-like n=1 Tax=Syzygium oleosum TaxID=219896 RepID=UPI0024B90FFA|nr:THO complex subunit 4A-like [Syzygium oleosum]